ncbi:MAG: hypothetical protein HKM93_08585 [Desulfobacteraceae bacterium]|nr:hypothetical protein [Desulfobacteraceae bacterium]
MLEQRNIAPRVLDFSSVRCMHEVLKRGIGITICPEKGVHKHLFDKSLVRLAWDMESMETSLLMIWHAEKWCSPLLRRFMEISRETYRA